MFYVYELKTICPGCCEKHPKIFGLTQCNNLRVLKHRLMTSTTTDVFIRKHPKLFVVSRVTRDLPYEDAYTIMCSLQK